MATLPLVALWQPWQDDVVPTWFGRNPSGAQVSRKNFNFEKYVTSHIKEQNTLDSLHHDYDQAKFPEAMKLKYFQDGITDPTFDNVKLSILHLGKIWRVFRL